jgi:putative PIN family toxin of toxin-antitoxin system
MRRKPKVFLDTNAFISGMVFAGNERRLLDAVIDGKLELTLSPDVIEETNEVLRKKFPKHVVLFPLFLKSVKRRVITRRMYRGLERGYFDVLEDKGDIPILAAAVAARVDYLVTGDRVLLQLKKVENTSIVRARELLEKLPT